jgi:hypothetical protein
VDPSVVDGRLGSDVGEVTQTPPCVNSERRHQPRPQETVPPRRGGGGINLSLRLHRGDVAGQELPRERRAQGSSEALGSDVGAVSLTAPCVDPEEGHGQEDEQRGDQGGHLQPVYRRRHRPSAHPHRERGKAEGQVGRGRHLSGGVDGRPGTTADAPVPRWIQDEAREGDGDEGLGSDVGGASQAPPCVNSEGTNGNSRNDPVGQAVHPAPAGSCLADVTLVIDLAKGRFMERTTMRIKAVLMYANCTETTTAYDSMTKGATGLFTTIHAEREEVVDVTYRLVVWPTAAEQGRRLKT